MISPDVRNHTRTRFALFALVALSALVTLSLLARDTRAAGATPAHLTLAGGTLAVSPANLTNCKQCTVTVSNESPNRSLTWFAVSHGTPGVMVNPSGGTLQRKGQVSVTITLPSNITCPTNDTITFIGSANSVNVSWSCQATPTPTPTPSLTPSPTTPTPTPTSAPTQLPTPTPSVGPTQTASNPGPTPTATSALNGNGQRNDGNPPATGGSQDSSALSILLSVAALALALLAFALYLMQPARTSLRTRLLSLILPIRFLRKLDQNS